MKKILVILAALFLFVSSTLLQPLATFANEANNAVDIQKTEVITTVGGDSSDDSNSSDDTSGQSETESSKNESTQEQNNSTDQSSSNGQAQDESKNDASTGSNSGGSTEQGKDESTSQTGSSGTASEGSNSTQSGSTNNQEQSRFTEQGKDKANETVTTDQTKGNLERGNFATTLNSVAYTLANFPYTVTFTQLNGNPLPNNSSGSPINANSDSEYVVSYNVKLPDTGVRVKGGDTLSFNFNQDTSGIAFSAGSKPLSLSNGRVGANLSVTSNGQATITFTSEVENLSNITVNVALTVKVFSSSVPTGTKKTVMINNTPYYFNKVAEPGAYTSVFGKRGDPLSRNLIMWSAVGTYVAPPSGVTQYTNLVIDDDFEANLTLVKIPADRQSTHNGNLVPEYITISCGGVNNCPAAFYDVDYTLKTDATGRITGFTIEFRNPVPANRQFWIFYYTNALDNGDKKQYSNNISFTTDELGTQTYRQQNGIFTGGITGSFAAVKILKYDEQGNPQNGPEFKLEKLNDVTNVWQEVDRLPVEFGQAYFSGLLIGKYRLIETQFNPNYGPGYLIVNGQTINNPNNLYEFDITTADLSTTGQFKEIKVYNVPTVGGLTINKKDDTTGVGLAGAEFVLKDSTGAIKYTLTTGAGGTITRNDILQGTYTLEETKAPDNYVITSQPETITITASTTITKEIVNKQKKFNFKLKKVDAESGVAIQNAGFTLQRLVNGNWVNDSRYIDVKTNANGEITFTNLVAGTYKAVEVSSPVGYIEVLTESNQITFLTSDTDQATKDATVTNEIKKFSIELTKTDSESGVGIANAGFKLQKQNGTDWVDDPRYLNVKTNASGKYTFTNLLVGTYRIVEVESPLGYVEVFATSGPITFEATEDPKVVKTVTLTNEIKKFKFELFKTDAESGDGLANVRFALYKQNGSNWDLVPGYEDVKTDSNGLYSFSGLLAGTYKAVELESPVGYEDTLAESRVITFAPGDNPAQAQTATVTNKLKRFTFELTKTDADSGDVLPNVAFTLFKQNGTSWDPVQGYENVLTDSDGMIIFDNLLAGTYKAVELQSPVGYYDALAETRVVTFNPTDDPAKAESDTVTNELKKFSFELTKTDSESGAGLANVPFTLYKKDGTDWVEVQPYVNVTTNSNGKLLFSGLLAGTYKAVEKQSPLGYTVDLAESKEITFAPGDDPLVVQYDTVTNTLKRFVFVLTKIDSESGAGLANVPFTLYKKDGANWVEVQPYVNVPTNSNGQIFFTNLLAGTYKAVELESPLGYTVDLAESQEITFDPADDPAIEKKDTVTNTLKRFTFELTKTDVESGDALANVPFTLYKKDGTSWVEVQPYVNVTTDSNGKISFTNLLAGTYKAVELQSPLGYEDALAESAEITFEPGDDPATVKKDTVTNKLKRFTFELTKLDEESEEPLAGVEFALYMQDGTDWVVVSGYESVTTDSDGKISFTNLLAGTYKAIEVESPIGYEDDLAESAEITFEPGDDPATIKTDTVTNKLKRFTLELTKVDAVSKEALAGVPFTLYVLNGTEWEEVVGYENVLTDSDGMISFTDLLAGTYKAVEQEAPFGYLDELVESEEVTFDPTDASAEPKYVEVENTPFVNVTIIKEDDITRARLAGAEFQLYYLNSNNEYVRYDTKTYRTDANGTVTMPKLVLGKYRLVETKAPDRYSKLKAPVDFEITQAMLASPGTTITLDAIENELDPNDPRNGTKDDTDDNPDDPNNPNNPNNNGNNSGKDPNGIKTPNTGTKGDSTGFLPQLNGSTLNSSIIGVVLISLSLLLLMNRRRKKQA